ncbi:hypothetical protein MAR_026999 [Mya arenaria]|uniref:H-type lectin domain-containing protein n=1 Tax=Mya arenaria TaxID=6604 RepID=A0ABY7F095_MYAAR|nr:uncharacterized protein LOC128244703 [Mya arenaria]XP_052818731.1 uncharacterized protein LOC128244719 [Mya arenaria]WAR12791.1 hypothetical protein MAR_026971 [Mya arenaria]WAR12819.1 hypothetical protein MAR_026999 [Mya arenaria]
MRYLKLILCAICVHVSLCVPAPDITDSTYQVLSSKIDTINLELALLRNEQVQTKQELIEAKTEIRRIQENQTDRYVILLREDVTLLKSKLVNVNAALEQRMTSLKETVSGINTSLEEKCQSGEFGPHHINPRPSYPVTLTINFQPAFKSKPAIVYGLKVLDSAHNANVRVSGSITEMTNAYFKFTISEWANTVMYGAKFSWMACPKTNT